MLLEYYQAGDDAITGVVMLREANQSKPTTDFLIVRGFTCHSAIAVSSRVKMKCLSLIPHIVSLHPLGSHPPSEV